MNALRLFGGVVGIGIAGVLAFHLIAVLRPIVLPTLRELGQEQTTFFILHVWGWSLVGWQIILFEVAVAAVCVISGFLGVYALTGSKSTG